MMLTIELPDTLDSALQAQARAKGVSAAGFARQILEQALTRPAEEETALGEPFATEYGPHPRRPLSARIRDLWVDMPDEVRAEYPEGGGRQIDHHVYGLPKR